MTARVLDEATKKALQGVAPFSSTSTINFTPDCLAQLDLAEEFIPVFSIRGMTVEEGKALDAIINSSDRVSDVGKFNEQTFELTRKCITGWVNIFDAGSGQEVAYAQDTESSGVCKALWESITINVKNALFKKVMEMHGMGGAKVRRANVKCPECEHIFNPDDKKEGIDKVSLQ